MNAILSAREIWRLYNTDGVPGSGPHPVNKRDVLQWGSMLESLLAQLGLGYATKAALDADLAHGANTLAMVYADSTAANNGIYVKSGTSGSGSWSRIGDLPDAIIPLTVTGGTGNAIVATAPSTPLAPGRHLYLLVPTANNTGSTTIAINGTPAVPIKNALNANLASGSLIMGSAALMCWATDHYQLLVAVGALDGDALVADAVAAKDAAEDARDTVLAAASSTTALWAFPTKAAATAFATPSYVPYLYTDGRVAAGKGRGYWTPCSPNVAPAHGEYILTNGRYFEPSPEGAIFLSQFGSDDTGASDNNAAFQRGMAFAATKGLSVFVLAPGLFKLSTALPDITQPFRLIGAGRGILGPGVTAISRAYNEADASRGCFNFVGVQNIGLEHMTIVAQGSTGGSAFTVKSTALVVAGYSTFDSLYCTADAGANFANTIAFIGDLHTGGTRSNFINNSQIFGGSANSGYFSSCIHLVMTGGGFFQAGGTVGNVTISGGTGGGAAVHPASEDVVLRVEQIGGQLTLDHAQYCVVDASQIVGDIINNSTVNNFRVHARLRAGLGFVCQTNWDTGTCSFGN
ncbi:hypothetical protein J4G43_004965 [Bradyrhizobium barranii subsp. barranii]|uniref:Pectate lyase superfamily protein domain-containing protein n=1 Tax=Bradyrhizobium barranii subsp. barranii TaxID=2823807 RepID=A0A939M3Q5_9BRAD|nr:hypothetical protein [Bradyrhizobium barranii]UEM13674.1 hypothetical protein J4G43_004965 [Bradyrhizobium barranii subsp. barranii]